MARITIGRQLTAAQDSVSVDGFAALKGVVDSLLTATQALKTAIEAVQPRELHTAGLPVGLSNRLPVDVAGMTITGPLTFEFTNDSIPGFLPGHLLAANEVFTSGWLEVKNYALLCPSVATDVASAPAGAWIEFSTAGSDASFCGRTEKGQVWPTDAGVHFETPVLGSYARFCYTNGPAAQTRFAAEVIGKRFSGSVIQPVGAPVTDLSYGTQTGAGIRGRLTDGSGNWVPLAAAPDGALTVHVDNLPATQAVTVAALPLPADAATATKQDAGNTSLASLDAKMPASPAAEHVTAASPHAVRLSDGTGFLDPRQVRALSSGTDSVTVGALPLPANAATATRQDTGNTSLASLDAKAPALVGGAIPVREQGDPERGTWGYKAGTSGTPAIPAGARVVGIAAYASTAGTVTINGGDAIPVPAVGFDVNPKGQLVAPTIVFVGTDLYFVEYVT